MVVDGEHRCILQVLCVFDIEVGKVLLVVKEASIIGLVFVIFIFFGIFPKKVSTFLIGLRVHVQDGVLIIFVLLNL